MEEAAGRLYNASSSCRKSSCAFWPPVAGITTCLRVTMDWATARATNTTTVTARTAIRYGLGMRVLDEVVIILVSLIGRGEVGRQSMTKVYPAGVSQRVRGR